MGRSSAFPNRTQSPLPKAQLESEFHSWELLAICYFRKSRTNPLKELYEKKESLFCWEPTNQKCQAAFPVKDNAVFVFIRFIPYRFCSEPSGKY